MPSSSTLPSADQLAPNAIQHWGETLGSEKMASMLSQSSRFSERILGRVYKAHHLDPAILGDFGTSMVQPYLQDQRRFTLLCGLIIYGSTVRKMVSSADYKTLSSSFDQKDLALACQQTDLHVHNNEVNVPINSFAEIVARAGETLVETWKNTLPQSVKNELGLFGALTSPASQSRLTRIDPELCQSIAIRVSGLLGE